MYIDTHAHLYVDSMLESKPNWSQHLINNQIAKVLLPNINIDSLDSLHRLCDENPSCYKPMLGIHPCDIKNNYLEDLGKIKAILYQNHEKYCGVGEIGLDYHWDTTYIAQQKEALEIQFNWAIELKKAVSIHSRKSNQDLIPMLKPWNKKGLKGVMHCFSGSLQEANQIIDAGFLLGIGGVITYPKSGIQDIIKVIPLDYIVLETDSPYLTPVPYRGKQNESSYIVHIAACIAQLKNCSIEEVANTTTENAIKTFDL